MGHSKKLPGSKHWPFAGSWVWANNKSADAGLKPHGLGQALARYGFGVLAVLLALGISLWLEPYVGGSPLYILFVTASLATAWFAGLGPGIAALTAGLMIADFFFMEPVYHIGPSTPQATIVMLINVCGAGVGLAAIVYLHRTRLREQQLEMVTGRLEREIVEHRKALEELREAKSQLDKHAELLESRVAERTATLSGTVKSLEGVLYHVAHDLRSPLRSLAGFTDLLHESIGPCRSGEEQYMMDRISSSAQRMDRLILDLLTYGRLGFVRLNLSQTRLENTARRVIKDLEREIERKQAEVEVFAPMPCVQTDDLMLGRALQELLSNALTYTAAGVRPHVRIWTEPRGEYVRLWVEDNGIGIDPVYRERVFGIFERLHPVEHEPNTGIGLAIVAKAMERLGGSAGVESELGKGSRFWLEVPLALKEPAHPEPLLTIADLPSD